MLHYDLKPFELTRDIFSSFSSARNNDRVIKTEGDYTIVEVELPGVKKEDINIKSNNKEFYQQLTVSGKSRNGRLFNETFALYEHDIGKTEAEYKDGLLIIKVPKTTCKARDIPIK